MNGSIKEQVDFIIKISPVLDDSYSNENKKVR